MQVPAKPSPASRTPDAQPSQQPAKKDYGSYKPAADWSAVQAGSASLSRGQGGPSVEELQRQMNAAGAQPPLDVDGKLGPKTEAAVRRFQAQNGLTPDGSAGAQTLSTLDRGATFQASDNQWRARTDARNVIGSQESPTTAPTEQQRGATPAGTTRAGDLANASRARTAAATTSSAFAPEPGRANGTFASTKNEREQQAEQLLRTNGQWPPVEGRTYAIQIDQDAPPADASRRDQMGHLRSYSGETSVFRAVNGRLEEATPGPLRSASHPGQASTNGRFTDVNGDGNADIAHLRAGVYDYGSQSRSGRFNPTDHRSMKVARDLDQDGAIDRNEAARDYYATSLQWHEGGSSRPSSVGCQTMPPDDYRQFSDAVGAGDGGFTYVLVRRPNDTHGANPF